MTKNDSSSSRTKHIDIQYHFVRDSLSKGMFLIDYCSTKEMAADLLTKPLQCVLIEKFNIMLGLHKFDSSQSLWQRGRVGNKYYCHISVGMLDASQISMKGFRASSKSMLIVLSANELSRNTLRISLYLQEFKVEQLVKSVSQIKMDPVMRPELESETSQVLSYSSIVYRQATSCRMLYYL